MPRLALASLPVMFHVMVVGEVSEVCSKETVPVIFESPRMKATMGEQRHQQGECLEGAHPGAHPGVCLSPWEETCSAPPLAPGARDGGV